MRSTSYARRDTVNRWLDELRIVTVRPYIIGSRTFDRPIRITRVRVRRGVLEGKRLDTGRWIAILPDDLLEGVR